MLGLSFSAESQEAITSDSLEEFISSDARLTNRKDIDGLMALYSDDYVGKQSNGDVVDKASFKLRVANAYINFLAVLRKVEIQSYQIAPDGQSADLMLIETTKVLAERNGKKVVFPEEAESKVKVILENGFIKYSSREVTRRRQ